MPDFSSYLTAIVAAICFTVIIKGTLSHQQQFISCQLENVGNTLVDM